LKPQDASLATEAAKEAVIAKNDGGAAVSLTEARLAGTPTCEYAEAAGLSLEAAASHPLAAITVMRIAGLFRSADMAQRSRHRTALS
jgi:hypothetical protein